MKKNELKYFKTIRDYFEIFLPNQKGASYHTIKNYKICMNQFLDFTKDYLGGFNESSSEKVNNYASDVFIYEVVPEESLYFPKIDEILKEQLTELINLVREKKIPFDRASVEYYYNIYIYFIVVVVGYVDIVENYIKLLLPL